MSIPSRYKQRLSRRCEYGGAARNTGDEHDTQCRAWSFETSTTLRVGHGLFRERGPRKVSSAASAKEEGGQLFGEQGRIYA